MTIKKIYEYLKNDFDYDSCLDKDGRLNEFKVLEVLRDDDTFISLLSELNISKNIIDAIGERGFIFTSFQKKEERIAEVRGNIMSVIKFWLSEKTRNP